jgi:murein L,D-transpeptidase YcbB/YkuD
LLPIAIAIAAPTAASVQASAPFQSALLATSDQGVKGFYKARKFRPIWIKQGAPIAATRQLIDILKRADLDGMESGPALAARLERALDAERFGNPERLGDLELQLSTAWVEYVQTLRRPVNVGMVFTHGSLEPFTPFAAEILRELGEAPSIASHLNSVSELNPLYSHLRAGLAEWRARGRPLNADASNVRQLEQRLLLNLDRARVLPGAPTGRYVLVDAASARLWLVENGQVRDSMRVVVGMPTEQTPMVAGLLKTAVLNPYWNVPPDLVRKRVAPGVLKEGASFLKSKNYELLSDWTDDAVPLDSKSVDWAAVAAGRTNVRVRQLPGPGNAMGAMKFMFPNDLGIYLHDTPDKSLFARSDRTLSSGCVRLEDAPRLANWLFGKAPRASSSQPEQVVALPKPVPVYITYLTAEWTGERFAFRNDVYGRDRTLTRVASSGSSRGGASPRR